MAEQRTPVPASPACIAATEPLESRVLFAVGLTAGTMDLVTTDFNADGTDDQLVLARGRRARQIAAEAGIAGPRRSSLFLVSGVDGSLLGDPLAVGIARRETPLIAVGDFNGDGAPDLVVAGRSRGSGTLQVLLGNGDGSFSRGRSVTGPANLTSLAAADVNGDGRDDLVATGGGQNGRSGARTRNTLTPDFAFELQDAGRLLPAPAGGGGVTAEAGGATGALVTSNPAFLGLDVTGLIALGDDAVARLDMSAGTAVGGTFDPATGVSGEAGGAVSRLGTAFSESPIADGNGSSSGTIVSVLLGNGDGTFTRVIENGGRAGRNR